MKQIIILFAMALLVSGCQSPPITEPDIVIASGNTGRIFSSNRIVQCGDYNSLQKALVIGNSDYEYNPLSNPVNDARDMAHVLKELGFDVTLGTNLTLPEMEDVIHNFKIRLSYNTDKEENMGLFYFSGHGASLHGKNYLIPINNGDIRNEHGLRHKALDIRLVVELMKRSNKNGQNIIALDASRDNPYPNSIRGGLNLRDLKRLRSGNIFISSDSFEDKVADSSDERNSLYTEYLLMALHETEMREYSHLEDVFIYAEHRVREEFYRRQTERCTKLKVMSSQKNNDVSLTEFECRRIKEAEFQQIRFTKEKQDITTIERYPTIECSDQVNLGQTFPVQISLIETENLDTLPVKIMPTPDPQVKAKVTKNGGLSVSLPTQENWEIEVILSAPAFTVHGSEVKKIILPRYGDSGVALFRLTPKPIQTQKQVQQLRATLWHKGMYLARIVHEITVKNKPQKSIPIPSNGLKIFQFARSPYLPEMLEEYEKDEKIEFYLGLQSPDVTIYLDHKISRISIHSNELIRLTGSVSKVDGLSKWLNDNYDEFTRASQNITRSTIIQGSTSQLKVDQNIALMKGFGRQLYDKFAPPEFKKVFWALKDKLGSQFDTIHIFTDDPIIPWELMIPRRGNEELNFLGIDFKIARWHINHDQEKELARPSQFLNMQKLLAIVPKYPDDNLAFAGNELEVLKEMTGFRRVLGHYAALSKLFKTAITNNSIIHFSGHGIVQKTRHGLAKYAIKLEDGILDLMTWRGLISRRHQTHPFFFFNACDVGQAHHVANFVDGWAPAVLEAGASGYIGGLWPLVNKGATEFAELFYQQLEKTLKAKQPANVADLLRKTRQHFYDNGDPTFLGYVYYGDPHFQLVRK
ncbi:caspase family protein [Candidatus Parabeggiatoa sp. HSG14]|uniref:caspase family protein n=1 Tax=Candidatus Parabeggiatoa sp. HSG14 TaxID=3055593 RepID=UPI0025A74B6C|nr:caspase family protein [Thiotrichales bacterium HSG14]